MRGMFMQRTYGGFLVGAALLVAGFGVRAETPLERGTYLMQSIVACGNCHTPKGPTGEVPGMELAGGFSIPDNELGVVVVPNITTDPDTGIGKWTDAQIITAIREGKRPDGSIIGPPMPIQFYRNISDNDVKAIVAYLRQVKPVKNTPMKSQFKVPLPESYGPPVANVADVPKTDRLHYGAYLASIGHCMECHTPRDKGRLDLENRLGAGGNKFEGPFGVSVARNITSDRAHGIGAWTDAQIKTAVTTGVRPDGERLKPPMGYAYYARISTDDFNMLTSYLRSLKPVEGP
jgi:mono/diheme cytochrome c family protein